MISFTIADFVCTNENVIIGAQDVERYAEISKDYNPIHLDFHSAVEAGFEREIVHGMLVMGIAESRLAEIFPTSVVNYYDTKFVQPVLVGEVLTFSYVVVDNEVDTVTIEIKAMKHNNQIAVMGVIQLTNTGR